MTDTSTILIVDDLPADLELLVDTLTVQGYQVRSAESGERALAAVAARLPDLILLDIQMPGLDGFEVCRRLKARPESRDIPILFVSASGERAERLAGLKLGAVDYITKPFEREELLERVQIHLEQGRSRATLGRQAADLRQANEQLRTEVAERKRGEEELRFKNLLLSTQQEASIDGILVVDEAARILLFNRRFIEIWGLPARLVEDRVDEPVLQLVTAQMQDPGAFLQRVQHLNEHPRETGRDELILTDGRVLERYSAPMFGPEGRYYGRVWYFRDISESKRAELEIQHQAAFARFNPNPVLELSTAGELNFFNGATGELARALECGSPKQMLPANTPAIVRECLATGQPKRRVETTVGPRVLSWSFFPVKLKHTVHCYGGDITEAKQAEEVLLQQVKLQDQLVRTAATVPGMIYSLLMRPDGSARMPYASGALSEIFDLQPEDVIDNAARAFSLIHPDDIGHVRATIAESARTLNPWRDDFRVCHTRLGEIWVEGHSVPQREPDGSTLWHGFVQDITPRKRMEMAMAHVAAIVESSDDAIIGTDLNSLVTTWNCGAAKLFGYTASEMAGTSVTRLVPADRQEEENEIRGKLTRGESVGHFETQRQNKDGRLLEVSITASPIKDATGKVIGVSKAMRDITERKQAEAALRRSETKFRALYDSTSDAVMLLDQKGFFDCNQATLTMFGCGTREDFYSKHPADVSPPVQPDGTGSLVLANRHMATAMAKRSHRFEWEHKRADTGETFPAEVLLSVLELNGKTVLQAAVRDITERRRSEARLRLQTTALEATANGVAITDAAGTILWVNPAFTHLTGFSAEEVIGQNPRVLKSGRHPEPFYRAMWETISKGHVWKGELINRRKDGQLYDEEMTITPVRDRANAISHFVAVKQDISQRRRAEEALREKEQLLSESQRLGHIGSWLYDVSGPMYWSDEFYRLFGVSPDTCTPSVDSLLGLIHPEDRPSMQAWIAACAAGEKPGGLEFRVSQPDGTSRIILGDGQAVHDSGNRLTHMAGTAQNITERKAAETELAQLHKQLLDASREAGMAEVATSVLHNVGNVLNSVNISTGLLAESVRNSRISSLARVAALLQEHARDLGAFLTADDHGRHVPAHLAQLSAHLLAEQKNNARELESLRDNVEHIKEIVAMQQTYATFGGVKEMVNVVNLVEDSLRMNEGAFRRHEVVVTREFEQVPPMNLEKHKILQILVNLLRNAKYACHESERADKRLTVRVASSEGRVKISVVDNGVGIPAENLTRIFNHGFTTRKDGHGFGLHSGALAARDMGGSLTVQSDGPGKGATFTLELPRSTQESQHLFPAPIL